MPRALQQQIGKLLLAQHIKDEDSHYDGEKKRGNIEDAAQALPAFALGVEKDLPVGSHSRLGNLA
jgi:hypothetical protein